MRYLTEGPCINFNGRSFTVIANMSCDRQNVIYVITFPRCKEFYIGKTGNTQGDDQQFDHDFCSQDLEINRGLTKFCDFQAKESKDIEQTIFSNDQQFDHDLLPCDLKINLLPRGIHCTKFGTFQSKGSKDIEGTIFFNDQFDLDL